jgi:photosystem II stability/assembly factor-like uncharacterized protein
MIRMSFVPLAVGVIVIAGSVSAWGFGADVQSTSGKDWRISGPFGGTATTIAVDPSNSSVLLAGGLHSLLYRTEDGGASWKLLPLPKLNLSEVTCVLIDPADPAHYLAGMVSAESGGLFESNDAGKNWHGVKGMDSFGVRALAVSPSDRSRFAVGTLHGVWLSTDSGKTWTRISDPNNFEMIGISAVAFDTKDPNIIYAGTSHLPWKTIDGGKTWESIHTGMIDDSDVFSIYVDPAQPSEVLASACSGIYLSGTRGDDWKKLLGIPNTSRRTHVIREDPVNPNVIFAGTTTGLFKSLNKGTTWKTLNSTQVNSLVFDPSRPSTMYLAMASAGIGKSNDSGEAIDLANQGFVDRTISAITRSGSKLVAVESSDSDGSGVFLSSNGGESWMQLHNMRGVEGTHLKAIAGLTSEDKILLAASSHQMFKSIDGGATWKVHPVRLVELVQPPAEPVKRTSTSRTRSKRTTKAAEPRKPIEKLREVSLSEISALYTIKDGPKDMIFAATDLGLLRSADAGDRWTQLTVPGITDVTAVYYSPNFDGRLIAQGAKGLAISKDYGDHWTALTMPVASSDLNSIAVPADPAQPLLAGTLVGLYASADGGAQWSQKTQGIGASTVNSVIYAGPQHTAYAAQYGQLYESTDGGNVWHALPTSIPALRIRQLWVSDIASERLYGITSDLGILFRN